MGRGVLVDPAGYFVGAFQWPDDEPAPDFNAVVAGDRAQGAQQRVILLTSEAALNFTSTDGRWRFAEEVWEYPTLRRWIVRRQTDNLWGLTGSQLVWPDRMPVLPDGVKFVDVEPPQSRSKKPIWVDSLSEWRLPRPAYAVGGGTVVNLCPSLGPDMDTVPDGADRLVPAADVAPAEDEAGQMVMPDVGDEIAPDNTPTIRCIPRYQRVPVRLLEEVLVERGLAADFVTFVEARGFTIDQVRALGSISMNNKHLREFVVDQGYTLKQAYTALQRAAEDKMAAERQVASEIGEVILA